MDRKERLLGAATPRDAILEIGPSYNPVAPKQAGWNSQVLDHMSREELRAKYAAASVDLDVIEPVDYLWHGGSIDGAVPFERHGSFDRLIASHVIEHTTDFVGFLNAAARLLKSTGVIALAVPDRRYCFDCFRPATTTGELIEAHLERRDRHPVRIGFDHVAYAGKLDGALGWGPAATGLPTLIDTFAAAAGTVERFRNGADTGYADYHAWRFTPAGFRLALLELGQLGLVDWRIQDLYGPENFEFFAILVRGRDVIGDERSLAEQRMVLLREQLIETREQIDQMLPAENKTPPDIRPAGLLRRLGFIR